MANRPGVTTASSPLPRPWDLCGAALAYVFVGRRAGKSDVGSVA
jgi:hypothetical protein